MSAWVWLAGDRVKQLRETLGLSIAGQICHFLLITYHITSLALLGSRHWSGHAEDTATHSIFLLHLVPIPWSPLAPAARPTQARSWGRGRRGPGRAAWAGWWRGGWGAAGTGARVSRTARGGCTFRKLHPQAQTLAQHLACRVDIVAVAASPSLEWRPAVLICSTVLCLMVLVMVCTSLTKVWTKLCSVSTSSSVHSTPPPPSPPPCSCMVRSRSSVFSASNYLK